VKENEEIKVLLIDFGRGQTINEETQSPLPDDPKMQDIYDYGWLLKDLILQWMADAALTTMPTRLFDIVSQCICGRQDNMRAVVDIFERWSFVDIVGVGEPDYIPSVEAWELLSQSASENPSVRTRSMPSARKARVGFYAISAEDLN
jgi:hypothetical protein